MRTTTSETKRKAYELARSFGLTIEYQAGDMRWTANVCAPEGQEFEPGLTMLCTSWLTKPNERFWEDVILDIEAYGPLLEKQQITA